MFCRHSSPMWLGILINNWLSSSTLCPNSFHIHILYHLSYFESVGSILYLYILWLYLWNMFIYFIPEHYRFYTNFMYRVDVYRLNRFLLRASITLGRLGFWCYADIARWCDWAFGLVVGYLPPHHILIVSTSTSSTNLATLNPLVAFCIYAPYNYFYGIYLFTLFYRTMNFIYHVNACRL